MYPEESSGSTDQSVEPNIFNQLDDKIRPLLEKVGDLPPIEGIEFWEFENSGPHQINNARDQYENLSRAITYLLNKSIRINEFAFEFLNAKIKARVDYSIYLKFYSNVCAAFAKQINKLKKFFPKI
uniref:Uncharacterized protein n=1 Tax=Meloidogyne enterolobii TaxID=390850 RepID=A0A6V7TQT4_MELEN|nr:unnamed protein product [Meloidogyne enterolobii]